MKRLLRIYSAKYFWLLGGMPTDSRQSPRFLHGWSALRATRLFRNSGVDRASHLTDTRSHRWKIPQTIRRPPRIRLFEARSSGKCLGQLSSTHREVMNLVYYQDKSIDEAAEIVGIPTNTVKSRMFYARARLAELLQKEGVKRL
jgi:DNA-directed RNA polymerase specialized sigma24 family protein